MSNIVLSRETKPLQWQIIVINVVYEKEMCVCLERDNVNVCIWFVNLRKVEVNAKIRISLNDVDSQWKFLQRNLENKEVEK